MTIAGSDPGGGAGLQADLKTFAACGVYGYSVITAVIAQNSARVARVEPVTPELVAAQIESLVDERRPDALKIGALATASIVHTVADAVTRLALPPPVVDPILIASSGARLLDPAGEKLVREELLPLACVVTPNLAEAEVLSGLVIDNHAALVAAARAINKLGPRAVLIKGGHTPGGCAGRDTARAVDLLLEGRTITEFAAPRVPGDGAHGTGCALSAAIAAYLARGLELDAAIRRAKQFVLRALRASFALGAGRPLLDHFALAVPGRKKLAERG